MATQFAATIKWWAKSSQTNAKTKVTTTEDIYLQTIAQKYLSEKEQMVHKLKQYGVQAVLTSPGDLSVNTINKYLELKARGLI